MGRWQSQPEAMRSAVWRALVVWSEVSLTLPTLHVLQSIMIAQCMLVGPWVQVQAPREASVWFQMGRCLKHLGRIGQALSAFNTALDLQPSSSDAALIKNALSKLPHADDSAEEEM